MNGDNERTYANLKCHSSIKQRNKRHSVHKRKEFPSNICTGSLGIVCFFLLLTNSVLGYLLFQCYSENKIQSNKYTNGKNMSSSEIEDLQPNQGKDCGIYRGKWSCCVKSCYYFSKEEKTWEQSEKLCQSMGSTLIKIDDKEEQSFIQSKIKYRYWVGLHKKRNNVWMWPDGTRPSPELNFQPFASTWDEKCGHLKPSNIVDTLCTREFYYICEKNKVAADVKLQSIFLGRTKKARTAMDLYENFKVKEKKLLNRNMRLRQKPQRHPAHTKREFPWRLIAANLGILCFLLLLATVTMGYMFFQCSTKWKIQDNKVTNEKSISSSEVGGHTPLQPIKEKDCDIYQGNWSCCGKKCYYFSNEEKTWVESLKSCQHLGSNLIKIDDQEEQLFIQSKIKYSYWIGLHKKRTNSPWMWTDGTGPSWKLIFQATTSKTEEKCGRLKSINIVDAVCTKEFHYICEKNLSSS